jgi:hypothetical protein
MTFGRPVPQRRVTVFFRPILAIPQLVVLYFLNIAASVLVFLGWFAALVTGRLPESFASFVLGFLRWRARVDAYLFLMTDTYPPFSLQPEPAYPIDVAVQTGRLNRLAVLFRYFIAIPAALAVALLYVGLGIFWIVTWVATLVKGEVPTALFEANAAGLRYAYRLQAYFVMLTSFYPAEVMGDAGLYGPAASPPVPQPPPPVGPAAAPMAGADPPGLRVPAPVPEVDPGRSATPPPHPPPPAPTWSPPPAVDDALAGLDPTFAAPVAPPPPPPGLPPPPPAPGWGPGWAAPGPAGGWRLILSPAARKLVVTYFIVGALGFAAYIGVAAAVSSGRISTTDQAITAQNELITAYNLLGRQSQSFGTTTRACPSAATSAGSQCLAGADAQLATDLQAYQHAVSTIDFPAGVAGPTAAVVSSSAAAAAILVHLSQLGADPQTYIPAVNSAGLEAAFQRVDSTTRSLNSALLGL